MFSKKFKNLEQWQINLIILWITQVISLTSFGFGIPFIPFYIQELGVVDPKELLLFTGILSAAPAITMAFMSPVWGVLSDRFGQKLMIQRAMFAAVLVIGGMGLSTAVWHLVALRLMQGLFTGTITASSTFVAVNTPNNKLSSALGILSSSTFIGYSIGPALGGFVAENFGFRASFYIGALIMLFGSLLVTCVLKPDSKQQEMQRTKSHKNAPTVHTKQRSKAMSAFSFMSYSTGMLMLLLFFHRIIRSVFAPFMPLYIQEMMQGASGATQMTGIINGGIGLVTALSALFIARLGDKYPKMTIIKIMLIIAFFFALGFNVAKNLWGFSVFYMLMFLVIGGIEPLVTATTAEQTAPDKRGALFGFQGLVGSLGWMVSPAMGTYISINLDIDAILWLIIGIIVLSYTVTALITLKDHVPRAYQDSSLK
jgi:DHA1 family multidrug resistance protein-like MFS transporter